MKFKHLLFFLGVQLMSSKMLCQGSDTMQWYATVDSLLQLSIQYAQVQKYDSAEILMNVNEKFVLNHFGQNSEVYAKLCYSRPRSIRDIEDNYPLMLKWLQLAVEIQENVKGKDNEPYRSYLAQYGIQLKWMYEYDKAEAVFLELRKLKDLGGEKSNYFKIGNLWQLISIYSYQGLYTKADQLSAEAIRLCKEDIHTSAVLCMKCYNELGLIYKTMGNFPRAEYVSTEAMKIAKSTYGEGSIEYSIMLGNTSEIYREMGQYEEAAELNKRSMEIVEKIDGKDNMDYAICLNNQALIHYHLDEFEKAKVCLKQSLEIKKLFYNELNPSFATGYSNLGNVYLDLHELDTAIYWFTKAQNILYTHFDSNHAAMKMSQYGLARSFVLQERYDEAKQAYAHLGEIIEASGTFKQIDNLRILNEIGIFYYLNGDGLKGEASLSESNNLRKELISELSLYYTENRMVKLHKLLQIATEEVLSYIKMTQGDCRICNEIAIDNILFDKEYLADVQKIFHIINSQSNDTIRRSFDKWREYKNLMAGELMSGGEKSETFKTIQLLSDSLEATLLQYIASLKNSINIVSWKDIQTRLKHDEIVLEFVRFKYIKPGIIIMEDSAYYAVMMITKDDISPRYITLFEEKELEAILHSLSDDKISLVNTIYSSSLHPSNENQSALYKLIWKPLEPYLEKYNTIYYSPDGLLHRLNPESFATGKNTITSDTYNLIRLRTSRILTVPKIQKDDKLHCSIFGAIKYELDTLSLYSSTLPLLDTFSYKSEVNTVVFRAQYGDGWPFLFGSVNEISSINTTLTEAGHSTINQTDEFATEEAFKSLSQSISGIGSPELIHLSTHGYFFPDPEEIPLNFVQSGLENKLKYSEHPMIRSGLILAGGNYAWKHGHPFKPGMEDGILTAYEISQMDLSNTELVVLSACETGLGDIEGNEGVYGLQRAFKIAGAKNLIMSLWKVPDSATAELMISFYKHWLKDKMTIRQALYTAQKELRDEGFEPYYWAGWVLVE